MTAGKRSLAVRWHSFAERIPRFPVRWILEHPRIEYWTVKAVWFVIPLEYYLVTSFSGGFNKSDFGATSIFALLYLMVLFVASSLIAIAGGSGEFDRRVRIWSIALIVTWGASLALVAFANFLSTLVGLGNDFVGAIVCRSGCTPDYPAFRPQTFLVYAIYSSAALAILCAAPRYIRAKRASSPSLFPVDVRWREPDVVTIGFLNAIIMTAMHAWANLG
jgi:hypothetical protein